MRSQVGALDGEVPGVHAQHTVAHQGPVAQAEPRSLGVVLKARDGTVPRLVEGAVAEVNDRRNFKPLVRH